MENNCYSCQYRGTIPGDAHSCCKHPKLPSEDFLSALIALIEGEYTKAAGELNIQANPYGVKSGWFMWPANFDPIWLRNCNGFKSKE